MNNKEQFRGAPFMSKRLEETGFDESCRKGKVPKDMVCPVIHVLGPGLTALGLSSFME
jgi:hypothetical protein